jgi:magnesium chelatase family protein
MLARVNSCALVGLEGVTVEVEVDISRGLAAFNIVGLPDAAVQESKERVRAAIKNAGLEFPNRRITVNLAPADVRKEGGIYDLPIAVGIMAASGQVELRDERAIFLGELSLDGGVRHANGVLPMVAVCQDEGFNVAYVPLIDAREAGVVRDVTVLPVDSLQQLVAHYNGLIEIEPHAEDVGKDRVDGSLADMRDIRGQEHAKRALEIAATGGHNVLMSGPPGTGKTLLARALASILPPMTFEESLEVTKIHSVAGALPRDVPLITARPVQAPHHTISHAGLVGGGTVPRPGAISLAHRGVLFLDEFPEFSRASLEAMRQPLEDGYVTIARAAATATLPARFMLVAAMNPSPSGYEDGDDGGSFSAAQMARYRRRISGPIMDRIDLHVEVPRIDYDKMTGVAEGEDSDTIRARVAAARRVQVERFGADGVLTNAEMGVRDVDRHCAVSPEADDLLRSAHDRLELSGRGLHRVLKLGRTIADMVGADGVGVEHVAEALQYRPRIRG